MIAQTGFSRASRLLGLEAQEKFQRFLLAFKFDPDQPRDEHGRWTGAGDSEEGGGVGGEAPATVASVLAQAGRLNLAARSDAYEACLDLCYPLLERFQRPGSDKNTWDFHKCMNICLGKTRQ